MDWTGGDGTEGCDWTGKTVRFVRVSILVFYLDGGAGGVSGIKKHTFAKNKNIPPVPHLDIHWIPTSLTMLARATGILMRVCNDQSEEDGNGDLK